MNPAKTTCCLLPCLLLGACFGSAPEPPRYFEPRVVGAAAASAPGSSPHTLQLRPVASAEHLKDRIVWRKSEVEFGFYDMERWTELPLSYVERALRQELFERRGLRESERLPPYALRVHLLAFEEVLLPKHQVNITLAATLFNQEELALLERTFALVQPVGDEKVEAVARAMGQALGKLARQVGDAVEETLKKQPPPRAD